MPSEMGNDYSEEIIVLSLRQRTDLEQALCEVIVGQTSK
jgi:hypothetical protein